MTVLNNLMAPKNLKGQPFEIFKNPFCSIIPKNWKLKRGHFGTIKKFSKKVSAKKIYVKNTKIAEVGIHSMFSRFWTSVLFWTMFWRFQYVLDSRSSSWTNEQKIGPNTAKKTTTVTVGHFFSKCKNGTHIWSQEWVTAAETYQN